MKFIEVVGGLLLGTDDTKWFRYRPPVTASSDYNTLTANGIYPVEKATAAANGPGVAYGVLVVFSGAQRIQIVGSGLQGWIYFRTGRDNGDWYPWVRITASGIG